MCGIFGVTGHREAAALTQLGLYSLQHRGQESAGIVSVDEGGLAHVSRVMGLVSEGFGEAEVAALPGPVAIGHTRYSTAGASAIENAQPVLARVKGGHIALVQEGDSITIDAHRLLLQLNVDEAEIARRRAAWTPRAPRYTRGALAKFAKNAASASRGAVLDGD